MKSIGQTLREARERQGLSIEDVAESTKIHPYKLMSIEDDDRKKLPARVFAIGLIKSYARELKVDMKLIDELCRKAYADESSSPTAEPVGLPTSPHSQEPPPETQPVGLFQIPKPFAIFLSLAFIMALVLSIYFVAQKMESYSQEEAQTNSILDFEQEALEQDASENDTQNEDLELSAKPKAQESEKTVPTVTVAPLPEKMKPTQPEIEPTTAPAAVEFEDDNNFEADSSDKKTVSDDDDKSSPVVSLSDQKLTVKALDKVRIEIIWSDGYNQGLILKRNESKTLIFSSPIRVRIDNGGAVEVSFNDKSKGVPGSLNKPIELQYP